jgi:hypothetical protein
VNRRRARRLCVSAITDIVSTFRKMSTKPDQVHNGDRNARESHHHHELLALPSLWRDLECEKPQGHTLGDLPSGPSLAARLLSDFFPLARAIAAAIDRALPDRLDRAS